MQLLTPAGIAFSNGASSRTMKADLPPSSRQTLLMPSPATAPTRRPATSDPVKLTMSTPGWATRYRPILYPRISGDGRFIVFQAVAEDGPSSLPWQVVLLDRRDGTVRVLSADPNGLLANGHCTQAAISADGPLNLLNAIRTAIAPEAKRKGA